MSGGYDPTETAEDSRVIRAQQAVFTRRNVPFTLFPRLAGSWPGFVFTGDPLRLPAGQFGLGTGGGAHAPDEFFVIEPKNPRVAGLVDQTMGYVDFLYAMAAAYSALLTVASVFSSAVASPTRSAAVPRVLPASLAASPSSLPTSAATLPAPLTRSAAPAWTSSMAFWVAASLLDTLTSQAARASAPAAAAMAIGFLISSSFSVSVASP
jgi:hypothetical protein